MTREEELIQKVKELTKIYNTYQKKLKRNEQKKVKLIHKVEAEREAIRNEYKDIIGDLQPTLKELWILQAPTGIHSTVYYEDIPDCVKWDYHEIENKITCGCSGDWYDGCRGCNRDCHRKADEEWKKKYGFVNVKYRKYGD